jgi:hypothetical protein
LNVARTGKSGPAKVTRESFGQLPDGTAIEMVRL